MVIEQISWTVEEQAEHILGEILHRTQMTLDDLFGQRTRMWIIVTFLALLELIREGRVRFHQEEDEVVLYEA
jgi:segregation and condensation protein A